MELISDLVSVKTSITFVIVDEVDENQKGDVEIHLREERSPARLPSRRGQTSVQLCRAGNKLG